MRRIWLKNYRCFAEQQEVRLAPLTLLVGDNSTGKTSFLAMIRALWDIAYRNRVPNFKEEPYDLGSFDEIAHFRGGRGGRAEEFESGFDLSPSVDPAVANAASPADRAHRFIARFSRRGTVPMLTARRLSNKSGDLWIEQQAASGEHVSKVIYGTSREPTSFSAPAEWSVEGDTRLLPFDFFASHASYIRRSRSADSRLTKGDQRAIRELVDSAGMFPDAAPLYAGAPVRSKPHRTYDPSLIGRDPEGDYIPMFLAEQHVGGSERWQRLLDALQRFGRDAGLFDEVTVKPLAKRGGPFQLQVRRFDKRTKGPHRNLIDVGYGVSQVLPIVTELLRQDAPTMFLLQQPEVHLHPSAQAALGSLFCRTASWGRQLVVETHSDHLLDRVRMDVRDGVVPLQPADVSILYFERHGLDVRIHSLRIDDEGNVLGAPEGYRRFFMEEVTRSLWKQEPGNGNGGT